MIADDSRTYIAGKLTGDDWRKCKAKLVVGADQEGWAFAYEDFFRQRLKLRYLDPIQLLGAPGGWQGEGFSIVSIQCALIEFLAACRSGKNYRFLKKGDVLGTHEYSSSSALFQNFLSGVAPFSAVFDVDSSKDFYQSIRCALLHEARTRNGWRIWVSGPNPIDSARKIVYRDALQAAILTYVDDYGRGLLTSSMLQEAFIRKFDDLAV